MTTATHPQAPGGAPARTGTPEITGTYQQAITGRYRRITTHQVAMAWWLYSTGRIGYRALRVYFAAHEMAERRRYTGPGGDRVKPLYELPELKALVGGRGSKTADRDLSADVKRLGDLGLVKITPRAITFATSVEQIALEDSLEDFWTLYQALPNRRRTVPVPRRTLRALAAGFRRGETAYILAALVRSVFWHKESGVYRTDGRTKGTWIAEVFGISRRAVTEARTRLIELGWLRPLEAPQWALNKWGVHEAVNLDWAPGDAPEAASEAVDNSADEPVGEAGASGGSASPPAGFSAGSASPCLNSSSLPTGDSKTRRLGREAPGPSWSGSRKRNNLRAGRQEGPAGRPNIRNVHPDHLKDTEALLELHRQAVAIGLACDSPAGQLDFLSMANRARTRGHKPGALLIWLLKERKTEFITNADEDAARKQLREHQYGPDTRSSGGGGGYLAPPELTEEERIVEACLAVARQHRIQDPFRVAQQAKKWTRTRWDEAYLRYRTAQVRRQTPVDEEDGLFRPFA